MVLAIRPEQLPRYFPAFVYKKLYSLAIRNKSAR